jgi:hypothetical protein
LKTQAPLQEISTLTPTLAGLAKAAIVALALGAGSIAGTAPAQAQGFGFSFGFGNNDDDYHFDRFRVCLTESQLRRSVENRGYDDVRLNVEMDNRIHIRATRGEWIYQLTANACSGRILERERLRHV